MSQRIRVLPENLCNKIAAGEVVERPASVVKELVENAIDAGATDILVEVESGGKRLIRVVDNGCGMSQDDAFLALERHATSKVKDEEDLFAISTLGFRGEALPSIASVSRLRLRTRAEESEAGWEIYAEGGSIKKTGEVGAPRGTAIEVRNLFFNTPARRKFMRRDQTEMGHVADVVTKQALACTHIRFRLVHGDRMLLEAHPEGALEARVATILGRPLIKEMLAVDEHDGADLRIGGLVSRPAQTRSAPSQIYTFINGRYIRDRVVHHAIMEGYRSLLMKGRYPVAVLFIDIDPALVDVNVHPTKQEVRFRDQRLVHDFISTAVRRTLRNSSLPGERLEEMPPVEGPPESHREEAPARPAISQAPASASHREMVRERLERYPALSPRPSAVADLPESPPAGNDLFAAADEAGSKGFFSSLQVLGQYRQSYILCQDGDDLVLVDQHAAHERVRFERLRRQHDTREIERQSLLFPLVLELDFREAAQLQEHLDALVELGFEVEPFGRNSFAVKALPQLLSAGDAEALLRDVVAELGEVGRSDRIADAFDDILMLMACHGSVRAKQALNGIEISALFEALDGVDFNAHCPHGRPVMVRMGLGDVERMFKRS